MGSWRSSSAADRLIDNGGVAWAAGLGALFAVDAALILTGHRSMSSHARSHPLLTVVGLSALALHLNPLIRKDP